MENKDDLTTIHDLKKVVKKFRDDRDWEQFHTPKNLVQALSIEAGELMEEFLWKTDEEIEELLEQESFRQNISDELADVLAFCLHLANTAKIDLTQALTQKMKQNEKKYPVEKSKGNATKYNQL